MLGALLLVLPARADALDAVEQAARVPAFPAPFALPELSHARLDVGMDWFVGSGMASDPTRAASVAGIARPSVQVKVHRRRSIFVGATQSFSAALPPDGGLSAGEAGPPSGTRTLVGNVELQVRAVFALPNWLEYGFTLGLVAPTATFDRDDRAYRSAAAAAASLDPTSFVHFLPERLALRPAGDLRIVRGAFVFQGRHGLDVTIDGDGREAVQVAGRLIGHVGWLAGSDLELSLEASQRYAFGTDPADPPGRTAAEKAFARMYRVVDGRRAALVLGPGVRVAFREAEIGFAVVTNVGSPLSPVLSDFVGVRVSVLGHVKRKR